MYAKQTDDGIAVSNEELPGYSEVVEDRPTIKQGQRHTGPFFQADEAGVIHAVYGVQDEPLPDRKAQLREKVKGANSLGKMREVLEELLED